MLPSRGAVKIRAKRPASAFRNVWNHARRMTLDVSANRNRIRMPHPYEWNLSLTTVEISDIDIHYTSIAQ